MNEKEEKAYTEGGRAVYRKMLQDALTGLGRGGFLETGVGDLLLEREETVAALRRICAEHGDNDWTDDLSLADVIEKHLVRHLDK